MNAFTMLLLMLTFIQGLAAGICVDKALVNLPARHKIGLIQYAHFARANDLGNGLKLYPYLVVGGGFGILAFTAFSYVSNKPAETVGALYLASASVIGYLVATFKAAPVMWSLKNTNDDEVVLKQKMNKFSYWNAWRALFQVIAFLILIWTVSVDGRY